MNVGSWGAVIVLAVAAVLAWWLALSPGAALIVAKVFGLAISGIIMGIGVGLVIEGLFLVRYILFNFGVGGAIGGTIGGVVIGIMGLM